MTDKPHPTVKQVLQKFTGLSNSAMDEIWHQVQQNRRKLDSCQRHDFQRPETAKFGDDYVCANCGGKARPNDVHWYKRGLEHGKETP